MEFVNAIKNIIDKEVVKNNKKEAKILLKKIINFCELLLKFCE